MWEMIKRFAIQVSVVISGSCAFALVGTGALAAEYRLFVNDANACRNAGVSGDVCLVAVGASQASSNTVSTATATTTTTTTTPPSSDCVVTTWNPCSNQQTTSVPVRTVTTTPTVATTTTVAATGTGSSTSTLAYDYGSGGTYATGATRRLTMDSGETKAMPFTIKPGSFAGDVGIVPTSTPFPDDGSGVRAWFSATAGGAPLAGRCAMTFGREGRIDWDQTGKFEYHCQIGNSTGQIYLNLKNCISARSDTTCSAAGAKNGGPAEVYRSGTKGSI